MEAGWLSQPASIRPADNSACVPDHTIMLELATVASIIVPCCGVAAVAGLVAWALLGQRRQGQRFAHAWQPFAQQVGGRMAHGGSLETPTVAWSADGRDLVLESYRRMGESNDRDPYTRMRLLLARPAPEFGLRSRRTSEPGLVLQNIARAEVTTGKPELDQDYVVTHGPADRLGQAFDAGVVAQVRAAQGERTLWLGCAVRHGQLGLEIEERGDVTESARLAAWQGVLLALAPRWERDQEP
jgi:hypothetical protein